MTEIEALQSVLQVNAFDPVPVPLQPELHQQQQQHQVLPYLQQAFNSALQPSVSPAGGLSYAPPNGTYNPIGFSTLEQPPRQPPAQLLNTQYLGMSYGLHPDGGHGAANSSHSHAHASRSVTSEPVNAQPVDFEDVKPDLRSLGADGIISATSDSHEEEPLVELKPDVIDVDMYDQDSRDSTPITIGSSRNGSPTVSPPPVERNSVPGPSRRRLEPVVLIPRRKRGSIAVATDVEVNKFLGSGRTDSSTIVKNADQKTSSGSEESRAMMHEVYKLLHRSVLQQNKPAHLFKYLRLREDDDGNDLPPAFEPTPQQLATIMSELNSHAPSSYLAILGESERYVEMFKVWLRHCSREPEVWEPALAPLLNVLSRIDMPVNYMQDEFKLDRMAKKAVDKAVEANLFKVPEIRKAYAKYHIYCKEVIIPKNRRKPTYDSDSGSDVPAAPKKRKLDVKPTPAKPSLLAAAKAAASAGSSSKVPGRADMSFFGANSSSASSASAKPKPKLPNFTKRPATAPASATTSLLASTMKLLKKDDPASKPAPSAPSRGGGGGMSPAVSKPRQPAKPALKLNKKGFAVRWADETPNAGRPLEAIRTFKQEAFELTRESWQSDGDGVQGMSAHDLDKQEGRLLHHAPAAHESIEEAIEWYEPRPHSRDDEYGAPLGQTPEGEVQDKRERAVSEIIYLNSDIPPTPIDAGVRVVSANSETRKMHGVRAVAPAAPGVAGNAAQNDLSSLLKNLTSALPAAVAAPPAAPSAPAAYGAYDYNAQYYQNPPGTGYAPPPQQAAGWGGQQQQQQHQRPGWNRQHDAPGYTGNRWARPPAGSLPRGFCKFHRGPNGCKLGSSCKFKHG